MDLATIFEWFAQESMTAAEQAKVPIEREMWLRLGSLWMAAAQRSHDEQFTSAPLTHTLDQHAPNLGGRGQEFKSECPALTLGTAG